MTDRWVDVTSRRVPRQRRLEQRRPRRLAALAAVVAAVAVLQPATPAGAEDSAWFTDVRGNVHAGAIDALAEAGITAGCGGSSTSYCPSADVTRGQMATFIVRALGLTASGIDHFDDDDGTTHEDSINRLADAGIALGDGTGRFRPGDALSREQMASFLTRAFVLPYVGTGTFADVSGTHDLSVGALAAAGITRGCNPEGTLFCPSRSVARDQMASFLHRALEWRASAPPPPPGGGTPGVPPPPPPTSPATSGTVSSQGAGVLRAFCNPDVNRYLLYGPHVTIDSRDLIPLPGYETQYVATREWVYHYESGTWTPGPWEVYLASRWPDYAVIGGTDFNLGSGWYAAYVEAYVYQDGGWYGPTTSTFVPYDTGSWWCHGWA